MTLPSSSPFDLLAGIVRRLPSPPQPPLWLVEELQRKLVLLLNHVLQQEPQAMERLQRQSGKVIAVQWQQFSMRCKATPAGLLDLASSAERPSLELTVLGDDSVELVQQLLQGKQPQVRIEGDVQLAAEVNWLIQHVRWDVEEDLSRIVGDVAAHQLVRGAQMVRQALQQWIPGRNPATQS